MKRQKQTRRLSKLSIMTIVGIAVTVIILTDVLLIGLAYRSMLQTYYVYTVEHWLEQSLEALEKSDFAEETVRTIRIRGIRVVLLDRQNREELYTERRDFDREDNGAEKEPARESAREKEDTEGILRMVELRLGEENGSFFSNGERENLPHQDSMRELVKSRMITLSGQNERYVFEIACEVESMSTAVNLAIRIAAGTSAAVLLLSLICLFFLIRLLNKPSAEVAQTAAQIAKLDFSRRCGSSRIREADELAQSINTMADQLQQSIVQLQLSNSQLQQELAERHRQQQINLELLANLSHDLKTPIAIISGYAQGLTEGIAKTEQQQEQYLHTITEEAEHMQLIVGKLLALGRIEVEEIPLRMERFDVVQVVNMLLDGFELEIRKAEIEVHRDYPAQLSVCSDYDSVYQVLVNLLQNAIFHIYGGNRMAVRICAQDGFAELAIANSALPFSEQTMEHLWDKMFRADSSRQRKHGEVGLGLSIVRSNMERLGQPYGVRNLPDNMVEFYFRLPLQAEETGEAEK